MRQVLPQPVSHLSEEAWEVASEASMAEPLAMWANASIRYIHIHSACSKGPGFLIRAWNLWKKVYYAIEKTSN